MKYVVWIISAFIAFFMFVPKTGSTEIRNLPVLIAILALAALFLLCQLIRRIVFMRKVKKALKNNRCEIVKTVFNPFAARFHGRFSVTFKTEGRTVNALLLMRKRKYQRYHFESAQDLEFYRSTRVVFNSTKIQGATVSNLVETKMVGKQRLMWSEADCNIVVFDKLPDHITDSKTKNLLGRGDRICCTNIYISDLASLKEYLPSETRP